MIQAGLWGAEPLVRFEQMPRNEATAHCDGFGFDARGNQYAVKFMDRYPMLPITELLCHEIGRACQLELPSWTVVEWSGRLGFGSNWVHGVINNKTARWQSYWRSAEPSTKSKFFGGCCGVDGFLFNPDRHFGNFILSQASSVLIRPHAGDYSCAWWMARWQPDARLPTSSNSFAIYRNLHSRGAVDLKSAARALGVLASIDESQIVGMMRGAPKEWCHHEVLESLVEWWTHPGRMLRIDALLELIEDGQLPL